jgi:hypothetical protein
LRFALLFGLCFALGAGFAQAEEQVELDIPAQPLAAALSVYGAATRLQMFVDAEMTAGRRSAAVQGRFAPEAALRHLLAGTGLIPRSIREEGFTLIPLVESEPSVHARGGVSQNAFNGYMRSVQAALAGALCRDEAMQHAQFRSLLQLWIDTSGKVTTAIQLTSTGDEQRDALLASIAEGLPLPVPPAGLPHPTTLLLAPSSEACGNVGTSAGRIRSADGARR